MSNCQLKVNEDPYTRQENKIFKNWFYFKMSGAFTGRKIRCTIVNGGSAGRSNRFYTYLRQSKYSRENPDACPTSMPEAWPLSDVVYSYDGVEWKVSCCAHKRTRLSWHS